MSDAWKDHWLGFVKPDWVREGLLQMALSAALNECEAGLKDDKLADALRLKVRGPLESEAWIPGTLPTEKKKGPRSAVTELVRVVRTRQKQPVPIDEALLSAVARWKEGGDPGEGLTAAVREAREDEWPLPATSAPPPVAGPRPGLRPARAWLDAAQALQAWRRLVPVLAIDPEWRERCEGLRARVRLRNEEGSRMFEWLAKWYSGEDHALFADLGKLIDDALGMADPKHPDAICGVTLPVRWPPLILSRELSGELLAELQLEFHNGSIPTSADDLKESWRMLRERALKALKGRLSEPGDAPPRKELPQLAPVRPAAVKPAAKPDTPEVPKPLPAEEVHPALLLVAKAKGALERSMELKTKLGPALEPIEQAIKEGKEVPLEGLLRAFSEATQTERWRGPLGDALTYLREALRLSPIGVELLPPDLAALGQPGDATPPGIKTNLSRGPAGLWGRVVGLRFGAMRGTEWVSEKQPAMIIGIGMIDEVLKSINALLIRTTGDQLLAEEFKVFWAELLKSEKAFREQFREFYRAYFRRYEAERPPADDPTAKAFHGVCEAMGLKRFDIQRSWDEARGAEYQRVAPASTAAATTLDWQVHPGWKYNDETGTLFLEARGVYK